MWNYPHVKLESLSQSFPGHPEDTFLWQKSRGALAAFIQTATAVKILNPLTIAWLKVEIRTREIGWTKLSVQ